MRPDSLLRHNHLDRHAPVDGLFEAIATKLAPNAGSPVAQSLRAKTQAMTQLERSSFYLRELGDIKVLKNDFVTEPSA